MTSLHFLISFVVVTVGLGWALTIWWLADRAWRLIQHLRGHR